jgi:transposase
LYNKKSIDEAVELSVVSLSTGHRWLDEWNEGGYENLYPKYKNCGRKAKLTEEQFKKLDEIMINESFLTTRKIHEIIKKEFNVDYSISRIPAIVHKLGYSYKKGYIIYSKMPDDAEIVLKKKLRFYNLKNCKLFVLDQVACQNLSNSPRTICKKSEKNILRQNPMKFSRTGIGVQSINGKSYIVFPPNSRKKEMIKFFMELFQLNSKNSFLINRISEILEYEQLKIGQIIEELEKDEFEDIVLMNIIINHVYPGKTKKMIIKDLKRYEEKIKMSKKYEKANKKKLEGILEIVYIELLKPLESIFKEEIELIIVLDNYTVHHAMILKEACKYLNITLIHLPIYSPKLNPIEQVWRTIKKELSSEFIVNEDFLIENFERLFYENVDKKSFTEKWVDKFIIDKNNDLLIADMCEYAVLVI